MTLFLGSVFPWIYEELLSTVLVLTLIYLYFCLVYLQDLFIYFYQLFLPQIRQRGPSGDIYNIVYHIIQYIRGCGDDDEPRLPSRTSRSSSPPAPTKHNKTTVVFSNMSTTSRMGVCRVFCRGLCRVFAGDCRGVQGEGRRQCWDPGPCGMAGNVGMCFL